MSGTLLCRRLVSTPKFSRYMCQETPRRRGRTPAFFVDTTKPDWSVPVISFERYEGDPDRSHIAMREFGPGPPCLTSCHFFLSNLLGGKRASQIARPFFAVMIVRGSIPDPPVFSLLVKSHCKQGLYRDVLDVVFMQMKAVGVAADDSFYRILMYCVCARFGPNDGYQLLRKLRSTHPVQLPLSCYNPIVHRFCEKKMVKDAAASLVLVDALMDMRQQGIFADEKIYKYMRKGRGHGGEAFLKPMGIGRQMFGQGIRLGAVFAANLLNKN